MTPPAQPKPAGFTLIELVISAALASMILVSAYLCLSSAIASRKLIEPRVDVLQSARVAMAILTADLRAACPLSKDFQFLGVDRTLGEVQADNLDFATHNYTPRRPREGDYCQVSFFLEKDPRAGQYVLWRRRNPTIAPDPLSGGTREEIARGLRGVRFEYYDGFDWYDTWGEIPGQRQTRSSCARSVQSVRACRKPCASRSRSTPPPVRRRRHRQNRRRWNRPSFFARLSGSTWRRAVRRTTPGRMTRRCQPRTATDQPDPARSGGGMN